MCCRDSICQNMLEVVYNKILDSISKDNASINIYSYLNKVKEIKFSLYVLLINNFTFVTLLCSYAWEPNKCISRYHWA